MVYTEDEAVRILEVMEDVLDRYDIKVPSPEDDQRGEENDAPLYGSVYWGMVYEIEQMLIKLCAKVQAGEEVRSYQLSGR